MRMSKEHSAKRMLLLSAILLAVGGLGASIPIAVASTPPTEPGSTSTSSTSVPPTSSTTSAPTTTQPVTTTEPAPVATEPAAETTEATPEPTVGAAPTIAIDLTNTVGGETESDRGTVGPGATFGYRFVPSCSGTGQGCVDLTVTDTFPAEVVVDEATVPSDIAGFRDVTWAPETRTLTVAYIAPLTSPSGATGLTVGGSDDFTVNVTLPADTSLADGTVVTNEATVAAVNAAGPPDATSVVVEIPNVETTQPAPATSAPAVATTEPTETTSEGPVFQPLVTDPTQMLTLEKTNSAGPEEAPFGTIQPGDSFDWQIFASCSSINQDCVDLFVVDTFPAGLIVDESTIPTDVVGQYDVTWDGATLQILFVQPLGNPAGETGLVAGQSQQFNITVTLPADTDLETGSQITNEATISAANAGEATDPSTVEVLIPRVVDVEAAKSFSDPSAIAGDTAATTTMQLSAVNQSSSSAEVTEMAIEDTTAATFEYLDFTSATVTAFPAGADQAQLFVCPAANAPCDSDDDFVAGGTAGPPAPAALDLAPTDPADVVGVRVVFTDTDGSFIELGAASVDITMDLRDTLRSDPETELVEIPTTTTIDNVATASVTDPEADPATATDDAAAQYQILPPTLILEPSKSFFADENGNYTTNNGEHTVVGENSGASMLIDATNASAFPIAEIVITEPSSTAANEFGKFNATSIRLTFPAGAANANVVVTYDDGTSTNQDFAPPGPTDIVVDDDPEAAPRVTSITVAYTGPDDDGDGEPDPTIEPQAIAGLGVQGNLNDNVDATDVADGIDNCADFEGSGGGVPGTTGTFVGTDCANLDIEDRDAGAGGTKTASQTTIPPDQPVAFRLSTTNTGNLPLFDVVVADPPLNADGTPPLTPTFENLRFLDATIENDNVDADITLEVFIPGTGWVTYPGTVTDAQRALVTGVRATTEVMTPTESFDLVVGMQARFFADPDMTIENCYAMTSADSAGVPVELADTCSPPLTPTGAEQAATLNKSIAPETVPERIPGSDPEDSAATVSLRVQNTGTLTAQFLQITDNDTDFWDAVDFAGFGAVTPPATGATLRADLLQVDAFVGGAWIDGIPGPVGSPTLPAGVNADQVRGLRFTFSSTLTVNDGYVITPCNEDPAGGCAGIVEFVVEPRLTLVSTGEPLPGDPVPDPLLDTATGAFQTQLTGEPTDIPPVTDDLMFRPGDPALDVNKTVGAQGGETATLAPGALQTFNLVTTNSGTANLPDLTVSDPLPEGILFDDTFADPDTGEPFTVTWSNLPDAYPEPPAPVFATSPDPTDPTRVGLLRWTFAGFDMPPNSSVTITFRFSLEPGVIAGQQITNTMGSSSPVDDLVCSDPNDGQVTDGAFGEGLYCTDPANVTVTAGANFASRKWVAGNPDLGWYNESTGELVPVGGGGCLALEANGRTYTTNPCIAIVNPGEQFHYVLRVQNAGTENATEMTIVDTFPAPGDTGVLGADRGTQWATAPTLAGAATYNGLPAGEIQYTTGTPCAGGSAFPCDDATWTTDPGGATALRMVADFDPDPLPPGGTVDVYFSMTAPTEVPRVADPTIAYNSLAHNEVLENGTVQPALEPLKVGVATLYGNLGVVKEIGDNPADLPLDDLSFTFEYECTISTGAPGPAGTVTATPNEPGLVTGIPSGSTCEVWEIVTNGGYPSVTPTDPAVVVIEPSLDPESPVVATATVTNDFPLGALEVLKITTGGAQPGFTAGPYAASVSCRFDLIDPLPGFPVVVELFPGDEAVTFDAPVGSVCTVVEVDEAGATTVTYDPATPQGAPGAQTVIPADETATATVAITNDFPVGSLVIEKEVSGPGVPEFSGGPFTFGVSCDFNGVEDVFSVAVVVPGSTDGTPVQSEPVSGLPVGATCTVTEIDSAGADIVSPPQTVTIEANEEANAAFVGVNNPFSAGTIAVAKQVNGEAADSEYVSLLEYTIGVQCAVEADGELVTLLDTEISATGDGEPVTVTDDNGSPVLLPTGARCWATESASGGATMVAIDHDSYENGIEVVADPQADSPQELLITVTNTYDPAILTVSKAVVDEPDPNADYTFEITCTIEDTDGNVIDVPLLSGESPVTLGGGESASFEVLAESTCTVTETNPPTGATVTFTEDSVAADDDPTDGTVTVDAETTVVVTNAFDPAVGPSGGETVPTPTSEPEEILPRTE